MATPEWRKSSHSGGQGGDCVEVARLARGIGLRDSKHPEQPHQTITRTGFTALVRRVKQL